MHPMRTWQADILTRVAEKRRELGFGLNSNPAV